MDLMSNQGLVEYIVENQVDLVISLNQSTDTSFKKMSSNTNFISYDEKLISPSFETDVVRKEINFSLENLDVICF